MNMVDFDIAYALSDRTSVALGVPFQNATRSSLVSVSGKPVARSEVQARGVGDMTLHLRRWIRPADPNLDWNVQIGVGIKAPTGDKRVSDEQLFASGTTVGTRITIVDQSIQPGDGGWGVPLSARGFKRLGHGIGFYLAGTYLLNPQEKSGVPTFRGGAKGATVERVMSIADQYVLRAGIGASIPWVKGLTVTLGGRMEGVPVHDLVGGSEGFRRPGFANSIEPGLSFAWGDDSSFSVQEAIAVERNRTKSVADHRLGGQGDAGFADYVLSFGYTHRY